ncbi:methyltransferase (TIGR00027 family) [Streptomyces sp. Ag109_O5-1]|uniref:class I SAM-dependent methyltransferase n=1 Tax=Streptomyces sp. Ag109_O5-1 TaxID=1938851 RepID=UPI000F940EDA|nr:class I SAM-dependent methyltransferase [Streptomyces sp. Ag109_O5-1]RPE41836.1 methyltransferase (TIGR00027 family) [Streptomyces sp. Ag109_O5-1]
MTTRTGPDHTAVRTALWRALHLHADAPPHVIEDEVGLRLSGAGDDWRARSDMDVEATRRTRASIVARARFVEDLVEAEAGRGVDQYLVLGAGLDTFAQRRAAAAEAAGLRVFEADRAGAVEWKRGRLAELGYGIPGWLRLVPVDFEGDWWGQLAAAGFDPERPAVVASAGVVNRWGLTAFECVLAHGSEPPGGGRRTCAGGEREFSHRMRDLRRWWSLGVVTEFCDAGPGVTWGGWTAGDGGVVRGARPLGRRGPYPAQGPDRRGRESARHGRRPSRHTGFP